MPKNDWLNPNRRAAQHRRCLFRTHHIDVIASSPLEASRPGNSRQNLHMPVIVTQMGRIKRGCVN
jgi:hypothetical protein